MSRARFGCVYSTRSDVHLMYLWGSLTLGTRPRLTADARNCRAEDPFSGARTWTCFVLRAPFCGGDVFTKVQISVRTVALPPCCSAAALLPRRQQRVRKASAVTTAQQRHRITTRFLAENTIIYTWYIMRAVASAVAPPTTALLPQGREQDVVAQAAVSCWRANRDVASARASHSHKSTLYFRNYMRCAIQGPCGIPLRK